jgi:hypothetical protein
VVSGQSSWLQDGDVLCFLWGTNWIYICYIEESRPPLWSSGQSSWLQIRHALWFLWGTNWIYICYVEESRPPLWSSGQSSWLQLRVVLCFHWGTNGLFIGSVERSRPPLWSDGQSSWLQIQRSGFYSRRYQTFWEVGGLQRGPISLVRTIQELLGTKSSCSGLENRECGRRDPSRWPRSTFHPQKLALTSPKRGCRSLGIFRSRIQATEFVVSSLSWTSVTIAYLRLDRKNRVTEYLAKGQSEVRVQSLKIEMHQNSVTWRPRDGIM